MEDSLTKSESPNSNSNSEPQDHVSSQALLISNKPSTNALDDQHSSQSHEASSAEIANADDIGFPSSNSTISTRPFQARNKFGNVRSGFAVRSFSSSPFTRSAFHESLGTNGEASPSIGINNISPIRIPEETINGFLNLRSPASQAFSKETSSTDQERFFQHTHTRTISSNNLSSQLTSIHSTPIVVECPSENSASHSYSSRLPNVGGFDDSVNEENDKMGPYRSPTFERQLSIQVNQPVGAMSLSPCGRDVALASRHGLLIIDLDNPYNPPRMLHHSTLWEVADAQWNVHTARDTWIVSTSNQKAIVWNLALPNDQAIEFTLRGHTRAVTDMNWHRQNPDILATCSTDSSVLCWDLREPRFPVNSFYDWSNGATQVKWNLRNPHILASSHGRLLRIWDDRKGSQPLHTICTSDTLTKINGVEFNRVSETRLITCAMDRTVKFWDYSKSCTEAEYTITTNTPVWKARYTPFGVGVILMPQRGDHSVHMYDCRDMQQTGPRRVHSFLGHTDQVKEFLWRCRGEEVAHCDNRDFQLVTWSKDRHVRLWPIGSELLNIMGHNASLPVPFELPRLGAKYRTYAREPSIPDVTDSETDEAFKSAPSQRRNTLQKRPAAYMTRSQKSYTSLTPLNWLRGISMGRLGNASDWEIPQNLGEELSWVSQKFGNVNFESLDVADRKCTISLNGSVLDNGAYTFMRIHIFFPPAYPQSAVPKFQLEKSSAFDDEQFRFIMATLNHIAQLCVATGKPCMDVCLSYLCGESRAEDFWKEEDKSETDSSDTSSLSSDLQEPFPLPDPTRETQPDTRQKHNIPLPKTSAAIFCGNNTLVCFFTDKTEFDTNRSITSARESHGRQKLFESFGILNGIGLTGDSESTSNTTMTVDDDSSFIGTGHSESDSEFEWELNETTTGNNLFGRLPGYQPTFSGIARRVDNSDIFSGKRISSRASGRRSMVSSRAVEAKHLVVMFDMSRYLPDSKELAVRYAVSGNRVAVCDHNARVSELCGFREVSLAWKLVGRILALSLQEAHASGTLLKGINLWIHGPSAFWILNSLLPYYMEERNIQMLAMLACVLEETDFCSATSTNAEHNGTSVYSKQSLPDYGGTSALLSQQTMHSISTKSLTAIHADSKQAIDAHPAHPEASLLPGGSVAKIKETESYNITITMRHLDQTATYVPPSIPDWIGSVESLHTLFSNWRTIYIKQLDHWGLYQPFLELKKINNLDKQLPHPASESLLFRCRNCGRKLKSSTYCSKCQLVNQGVQCVICELPMRTPTYVCKRCFHGGHLKCLRSWVKQFAKSGTPMVCAYGCGCDCNFEEQAHLLFR
ncbi:ubiquitin-protein ligase E3 [Schizosaccharomyces japonicus yFS275]|uniref:Ubiquitin-protein ligase E3 n=1 Tax=Schizosaccharomyces japonicus (strain yFS275 / FY16936) TaxID=402676 RepID=B6JV09_SCHJY|nr:ubiquitin-protein ligase E3 [Schizosaccharomyces japonicus yFS275]EEB05210.1 ubiquitin-protein ligase E3 [Schizosaccharomyces japonicus yFS275]